MRRRPTADPGPSSEQDEQALNLPFADAGESDPAEVEAAGTLAPEPDAGYVPEAAPDLVEATYGEHSPTDEDPTATIPGGRMAEAAEPLHDPAPSGPAGPLTLTPHAAALAAEACSKSGAVWVRPAGVAQFRLAWHVWHADAVHVVTGVGEQVLPPLVGEVEVAVRSKDDGSRVITFVAQGQEIPPSSADWGPAVDALAGARLNTPDPGELRTRWSGGATVYRLVPVAYESLGAGDDATPPGNVRPPRIAATTVGPQPFHFGGRKRRIRGIWKRDRLGNLLNKS